MSRERTPGLLSWVLWQPLKFAFISFALMSVVSTTYSIVANALTTTGSAVVMWPMWTLIGGAIALSAWLMLRKLPRANIDQRSFIALNNAQAIILAIAVFMSIFIAKYAQGALMGMMWRGTTGSVQFIAIAIGLALYYMYLFGLFISNVYAKFWRARAMGVSTWRIICTMPMGVGLLWIPGYILPEPPTRRPALPIRTAWYDHFTNWIASRGTITVIAFAVLTLFTGFMFGPQSLMLTGGITLLFAVWLGFMGPAKFRNSMRGAYSTFAIIVNILLIIGVIMFATMRTEPNVQINISDIQTTTNIEK